MKLDRKQDLLLVLAGLVGLVLFAVFAPRLYPLFGVRLELSREDAVRKARDFADRWLSVPEDASLSAAMEVDREQLGYLQTTFGHTRTNELTRDSIPAFTWRVKWSKPSVWQEALYSSQEEAIQAMASKISGELSVKFDTRGQLVGFSRRERKTSSQQKPPADSLSALTAALDFLIEVASVDTSGLVQVLATDVPKSVWGRGKHVYAWKEKRTVAGESIFHVVGVGSTGVVRYNRSYVPANPYRVPRESAEDRIAGLLLFMTLAILVIVLAVRRLKADQMDLAMGIWPGVVVGLATAVSVYSAVRWSGTSSAFELTISTIFGTLFGVAAVVFLVALTDSLARDVWPEKVTSWTALLRGRVMNRPVGYSLLMGLGWATAALGASTVLDWVTARAEHTVFLVNSPVLLFTTGAPFVLAVGQALSVLVTAELAYRGFSLSIIRRYVSRSGWLLVAGFVIGALAMDSAVPGTAYPRLSEILRDGIYGLLLSAAFLRHDLLTAIVAALAQRLLLNGATLLSAGLSASGWEVLACVALLGVVGLFALRREVPEPALEDLEPSYVQRLAERERIRRELEIARHVQQTFLPRETPQVRGLDVASRCVPAAEVGGDYYDLIKLGPSRLGVVIGDVSGKGIGAAFYMTLTKGFLRAFAGQFASPKEVLVRVNELFYENAERSRFISMIYGIFDMEKGEFAFARAGHNPLLLRHTRSAGAEPMPVAPKGLALGLAKTELFEKVTEESRLRIHPGDVFVLYTDGFTEAMDSAENEFGELRLNELLREAGRDLSAAEILDLIYREVQRFSGAAHQHDDMTLIVVKVLETDGAGDVAFAS